MSKRKIVYRKRASHKHFWQHKKFYLLVVLLALLATTVIGIKVKNHTFSVLGLSQSSPYTATVTGSVKISLSAAPFAYAESAPWIVPGGWRGYTLSTDHSYYCPSPKNMLIDSITFAKSDCFYVQGPMNQDQVTGATLSTIDSSNDWKIWKRNYYGAKSGQLVLEATGNAKILTINHGENKNEVLNGNYYQNNINTNVDVHTCASGYVNGSYQDCWDAYNGFIGSSYIPFTAATNWGMQHYIDMGPIIWPQQAYLTSTGLKASTGVRHPESFIDSNYMYVYYNDTGTNNTPGKYVDKNCRKVARAQLDANGLPQAFKTYYQGSFSQDSLPSGFTKETAQSFLATAGGASDCIFAEHATSGTNDFSVAKIKNTSTYVGVEEYSNYSDSTYHVALRFSTDLVNWSTRQDIAIAPGWSGILYHYPKFLDKTGWSNYAVDADTFYVIGTNGNIYALKIQLSNVNDTPIPTATATPTLSPMPTPTPTPASSTTVNIAPQAVIATSSTFSSLYTGAKAVDGVVSTDWASRGEMAPWIQLNWSAPQTISSVRLFDRPNAIDGINNGTLIFSNGSTVAVGALPNNGTALDVSFAPKSNITWVKFQVNSGYGANVGLNEIKVLSNLQTVAPGTGTNAALSASTTTSPVFSSSFDGSKAKDANKTTDWASKGEMTPWIQLNWPTGQNLYDIKLYDRANTTDGINAGVLTFSDGSTLQVGTLANNGSAYEIPFPQKDNITWVKFQVTNGYGLNVGLSEIEAFRQ